MRVPILLPQTPAATALRSPARSWAATYPSSAPSIRSPSPPLIYQQSFGSRIHPVQVLKFGPRIAGEVAESWRLRGLRPLPLRNHLRRPEHTDAGEEPRRERPTDR